MIPVEGGLTRFMAVYSSHVPPVIGLVRSARLSNLTCCGSSTAAFAWSGATPHLVPFIERAPLVDLYALLVGGYYRVGFGSRRRTCTRTRGRCCARHHTQARRATSGSGSGSSLEAATPSGPCRPLPGHDVHFPLVSEGEPPAAVDGRGAAWAGGRGRQLGGPTVIIQYTRIATSRFHDRACRPPDATSVGSGKAVILRNGRAFNVHWSRPNLNSGTTFTLPGGKRMQFAPGQVCGLCWRLITTLAPSTRGRSEPI